MVVVPATTLLIPSSLVITMSPPGAKTVLLSSAVLLLTLLSTVPAGGATAAVLSITPVAFERIGAVAVKVATLPAVKSTVVLIFPVAGPGFVQTPEPLVIAQLQVILATSKIFGSKISVTPAPDTSVPVLVTTIL